MEHEIEISRERTGLGHPEAAGLIKKAVRRALDAEGVDRPCWISVMLTDDEGIRAVNREFRAIDRATDVLSFPMNELTPGDFDPEACDVDPGTGALLLGDMMISLERCAKQGEELGHGFGREIQYLTVHSVLHLLGYDHVDEGPMKRQMREREKKIMGDE
jgi:probable rRNA maturation factor